MDESPGVGREEGDSDPIGRQIDRYRIESKFDPSGMGDVYLARDVLLGHLVVLKRIKSEHRGNPESHRLLIQEAEKASRILDPRIVHLLHHFEWEGETWLVFEYVPGNTLRQRMRYKLSLREFYRLAIRCTDALVAAHGNGIVHRDIKPENYIVMPTGAVKLLDLGIAQDRPMTLGPDQPTEPMSMQGTGSGLAGTPSYIAPEVLLGKRADAKSDLFSLGVVLYEMLTGVHPFEGDTFAIRNNRVLHADPEPLASMNSEVVPDLERLVLRLLDKKPEGRPERALDVLHDLVELEKNGILGPIPLPTPPPPPPHDPWWKRLWIYHRRAIVVAAVILTTLGIAIGRILHQPSLPPTLRVVFPPLTGDDPETDRLAGGVSRASYEAMRRLTDPKAFQHAIFVPSRANYIQSYGLIDVGDATLLLRGRLTKAGEKIHIRLEARAPGDSTLLRQKDFEVPASDGRRLMLEVVTRIGSTLGLRLTSTDVERALRLGTHNPRAALEDLKGWGDLQQWDRVSAVSDSALAVLVDSASSAFVRAASIDSLDTDAWMSLATLDMKRHENQPQEKLLADAASLCQRTLSIDLDHPLAHATLGEIYLLNDRILPAISEFERVMALDPTQSRALRLLGTQYVKLGRFEDAEQLYRGAMERRPEYAYPISLYGKFCSQRKRLDEAAKLYERVAALTPREPVVHSSLGAVYLQQGRYESSISHFRVALALRPGDAAFSNLGTAYFLQRRFGAAESTYQHAVAISPLNSVLWRNLGDAQFWGPGGPLFAEASYREALRLAASTQSDSRNVDLLGRIAHCRSQLGDRVGATAAFDRAFKFAPRNPDLLYWLALSYSRRTETDSALATLRQALEAGFSLQWVRDTPELDVLRTDPRFEALVE